MKLWYCGSCEHVKDVSDTRSNRDPAEECCGAPMALRSFESLLLNRLKEIQDVLDHDNA